MEIKPLAVFDVDGTLYRSNLLVDLVHQLVRQGSFPASIVDDFREAQMIWKIERQRKSYVEYIDQLISAYVEHLPGLTVEKLKMAVDKIIHHSTGLMYVYARDLLKSLKKTHHLVVISGSPVEVVTPFVNQLGIKEVHGTTFEISSGVYTGKVLKVGTRQKGQTLRQVAERVNLDFKGSVAMGDTDSDIGMLDLVERPIAFNPNKELFEHAFQRGWEIVFERKDMILHLGKKGNFSVENNFGHFRQEG